MRYFLDIPFVFPGGIQKTFDLILPDERAPEDIPLLMWIHGGAWIGGEKRIYNAFERFSMRGYAVLSIDYRFLSDAPFPAQIIDCKSALRWARANAEKYGYHAEKVIVGGESAGAHLAALMGTTNGCRQYDVGEWLEYSSDVQAVVDKFGPVDLRTEQLPAQSEVLKKMLPDEKMVSEASPIDRIHGNEPPFLIMHGTKDPSVPIEQSRRFAQKLRDAGVDVTYLEVPDGKHGFDTLEAYQTLTAFIQKYLPLKDECAG